MGNLCCYNEPVEFLSDTGGIVCMILRQYDKFRLLHAPPEVVEMARKVVSEISNNPNTSGRMVHGAVEFRLPNNPFIVNSGKTSATIGKVFAIRIFEEMHAMGYDLVVSTDLSRSHDQSSWFFRRVCGRRPKRRVMCVAPGGHDKLILVRGTEHVASKVRAVVSRSWEPGLQDDSSMEVMGESVHKFKLRGWPWFGQGEESTMIRWFFMDMICALGKDSMHLLAATSIKGGTDSLLFAYDSYPCEETRHIAVLSLNRYDRVRLINFDDTGVHGVRHAIMKHYPEPKEQDYHGAHEFKLKGSPFACSGDDAIKTRRLIIAILTKLRSVGWNCFNTIDISRKVTDKSVFLFQKTRPERVRHGCVALSSSNRIRLIDFPHEVSQAFSDVIQEYYEPGTHHEMYRDESCIEIDLAGSPWTYHSVWNLHARSMLVMLLKEAFRRGWRLAASADVSAKFVSSNNNSYPMDVHSWFFCFEGCQSNVMEQSQMPPGYYEAIAD